MRMRCDDNESGGKGRGKGGGRWGREWGMIEFAPSQQQWIRPFVEYSRSTVIFTRLSMLVCLSVESYVMRRVSHQIWFPVLPVLADVECKKNSLAPSFTVDFFTKTRTSSVNDYRIATLTLTIIKSEWTWWNRGRAFMFVFVLFVSAMKKNIDDQWQLLV